MMGLPRIRRASSSADVVKAFLVFKPKLLKILTYGGAASPNHILTEAGINMADPDFWRGGFKVVEGMIEELQGISKVL